MSLNAADRQERMLAEEVRRAVAAARVTDIHTHLYDPAFGELLLWGIDDLLVYHYLVAETLRQVETPYARFWRWSKREQADLIWDTLFLKHSPLSEACRGVVTTLNALGLDPRKRDLAALRRWFARWDVGDFVDQCFALAGVERVFMTNSPFDDQERRVWKRRFSRDRRFAAGLRIDPLLLNWPRTAGVLKTWGYAVQPKLTRRSLEEIRRFLRDWTVRVEAQYLMVSLSPEFRFPAGDLPARLIESAVLPHCAEFGLPFALMLGVKRSINPELKLAGDGVGQSDLASVEHLCRLYPANKFLVTVLARENQHELCVLARKFRNLHPFGCWWFVNVPVVASEISRMRLELLGTSTTWQHSDARVLDQLIYKWRHFREIATAVLSQRYADLSRSGWRVTRQEIEGDVRSLLGGAFSEFCAR